MGNEKLTKEDIEDCGWGAGTMLVEKADIEGYNVPVVTEMNGDDVLIDGYTFYKNELLWYELYQRGKYWIITKKWYELGNEVGQNWSVVHEGPINSKRELQNEMSWLGIKKFNRDGDQ